MTGPAIGFDPDRDLPRPAGFSFVTDTEVAEAINARLEQERRFNKDISLSIVLHRIMRAALRASLINPDPQPASAESR